MHSEGQKGEREAGTTAAGKERIRNGAAGYGRKWGENRGLKRML
jgi:hypothetical protein